MSTGNSKLQAQARCTLPISFIPNTGASLHVDGSRGGEGVHRVVQGQQRLLLTGRVRVWAAGLARRRHRVRSPLVVRVGDMRKISFLCSFHILRYQNTVVQISLCSCFYFTLVVGNVNNCLTRGSSLMNFVRILCTVIGDDDNEVYDQRRLA
jgi:hypothetical protein